MLKRLVLSLALLVAFALPVHAQSVLVSKGATLQSAASATGNGSTLDVSQYAVVTFQTTISATATVTYEGSNDNTNWSSLTCYTLDSLTATSTSTATQFVRCNINGIPLVRARISAYTSGTVTVAANATTGTTVRDNVVAGTVTHGGAPTISGGSNVATLSAGSTDAYGTVTLGTNATTGTVVFTTAYTSAPVCVQENNTAVRGRIATTATTGFGFAGYTGADVFMYHCQGGN